MTGVTVAPSAMSHPAHPAYSLPARPFGAPTDGFIVGTEFAHLHLQHDGSLHMVLPPWLVGQVTKLGWAELHPVAAHFGMPLNVVMVYAPRDEADVKSVWELLRCSCDYASGKLVHPDRPLSTQPTVLDTLYDARTAGDLEAAMACFDPDVLYEDRAWPLTMLGVDEVSAFLRRSHDTFEGLRFCLTAAVASDRYAAGEVVMNGVAKASAGKLRAGGVLSASYAVFGELSHGRITRLAEYYDPGQFFGGPDS